MTETDFVQIKDPKGVREYLVLAKKDFDPKVHKLLGDDSEDGDGADIVSLNVAKAVARVGGAETSEALDELEAAEKAHPKSEGGRKGVLAAIEERREALKG